MTTTHGTQEGMLTRLRAGFLCTLLAFSGAVAAMTAAGCNTTKGVGEDLEALGDGIADEAEEAKD